MSKGVFPTAPFVAVLFAYQDFFPSLFDLPWRFSNISATTATTMSPTTMI